jgi:hypothetical protein
VILEGVFARYSAGQYGTGGEEYEQFGRVVSRLAEAADEAVQRLD